MSDDLYNYDDFQKELKEIRQLRAAKEAPENSALTLRNQIETLTDRVKKDELYLKSKEGLIDFFHNEKKEELRNKRYQLAHLQSQYRAEKGSEKNSIIVDSWRKRADEITEQARAKKEELEMALPRTDLKEVVQREMEAAEERRKLEEDYVPRRSPL